VGLGFKQVHAFEPGHETCLRLQRNVDGNQLADRVRVNCEALGESDGWLRMQHDPSSPATSFVSSAGEPVRCRALDSYARENGLAHIDLLKLDVEGYEVQVLRGAPGLLGEGRISMILVEWAPDLLEKEGASARELWSMLTGYGYRLWMVCREGLVPLARFHDLGGVEWANLLAYLAGSRVSNEITSRQ